MLTWRGLRSKRTTQMQNRCITTNQGNFRILSIKSIHYLDNLYKKSLHGIVGETLVASAQHQCASSNGSAGGVCPILNSSLTTTKTYPASTSAIHLSTSSSGIPRLVSFSCMSRSRSGSFTNTFFILSINESLSTGWSTLLSTFTSVCLSNLLGLLKLVKMVMFFALYPFNSKLLTAKTASSSDKKRPY